MVENVLTIERGAVLITSLPPRLAALAGAVGTVQHPGQPVRYNMPTGWQVNAAEREEATSLLSTLTSALSPESPYEGEPGGHARGALLTKMINGLAGAAQTSEIAAVAKIEMYADAVDDLPAWAIAAAIRRWARGSCPADVEDRPRFAFPPAPATLRALSMLETEAPRRHAKMLANLLAAVPLEVAMEPLSIPNVPALRRM